MHVSFRKGATDAIGCTYKYVCDMSQTQVDITNSTSYLFLWTQSTYSHRAGTSKKYRLNCISRTQRVITILRAQPTCGKRVETLTNHELNCISQFDIMDSIKCHELNESSQFHELNRHVVSARKHQEITNSITYHNWISWTQSNIVNSKSHPNTMNSTDIR